MAFRVTDADIEKFIELNKLGLPSRAIAKATGKSQRTVLVWLDKLGTRSQWVRPDFKKRVYGDGYAFIIAPEWYAGYVDRDGRAREHLVKGQLLIGRPLLPTEVVHHIDGNRSNNHPMNLEVMTKEEHSRLHANERWGNV